MRKALKSLGAVLIESLAQKFEEGIPLGDQNNKKQPSLFVQVLCELWELDLKRGEEACIADVIGSYQNERMDVTEWINEVEKFINEMLSQSLHEGNNEKNSFWCQTVLLRTRKIRAKRDPNFTTFQQRVSDVGSASASASSSTNNMPPPFPSLREQLYGQIILLVKMHYASWNVRHSFGEVYQKIIDEMGQFLKKIKLELQQNILEITSSGWYRNKIAETKTLIGKFEPAFCLPTSQMAPVSLHGELRCKVRLLRKIKCVYIITVEDLTTNFTKQDMYITELREGIKEIDNFMSEMDLQLQDNFIHKNSDWYHDKIAETRKLLATYYSAFPLPSESDDQDHVGSSSTYITSVQVIKPSLFLQVLRELFELDLKKTEESCFADVIGSYQNEEFDEVMEWINEVKKFIAEINLEKENKGNRMNSIWCHTVLLAIRKIRAKRRDTPDSTFQRVKAPLCLREELYGEIKYLVNIHCAPFTVRDSLLGVEQPVINEVREFIAVTKLQLQLQENVPDPTHSDWYRNKIAETREMIEKYQPTFTCQAKKLRSSRMAGLLSLHEQLHREVRLMIKIRCVYVLAFQTISKDQVLCSQEKYIYMTELEEWMYEMRNLLFEITGRLLKERIHDNNSDWYSNKIGETRTLTAKCFSAFPRQSQDVGHTNQQPQIFLSFRGEDTRYGFTRHLYDALRKEGFNIFMDDEGLKIGDSISQVLVGAIEKSKLSIIIFSENFADSTWCLNEVVKILECKQRNGQQVWPIFYKVEPTDVRNQKNSYAVAMSKQETKYGKYSENVKKWKGSGSSPALFCVQPLQQ